MKATFRIRRLLPGFTLVVLCGCQMLAPPPDESPPPEETAPPVESAPPAPVIPTPLLESANGFEIVLPYVELGSRLANAAADTEALSAITKELAAAYDARPTPENRLRLAMGQSFQPLRSELSSARSHLHDLTVADEGLSAVEKRIAELCLARVDRQLELAQEIDELESKISKLTEIEQRMDGQKPAQDSPDLSIIGRGPEPEGTP